MKIARQNGSVLLLILLATACASGSGRSEPAAAPTPSLTPDGPIIEILNTVWNAVDLHVLIRSPLGVEEELGTVSAGGTVIFAFAGQPGEYRLRVIGDQTRRSQSVRIGRNSHVRWDLRTGFITESRRR